MHHKLVYSHLAGPTNCVINRKAGALVNRDECTKLLGPQYSTMTYGVLHSTTTRSHARRALSGGWLTQQKLTQQ